MASMPSTSGFQPQPAVAPLNDKGQQALAQLVHDQASRRSLHESIGKAMKRLTDSVAEINDRRTEDRLRHAKKVARLREAGEEEPDEEQRDYEAFQNKVDTLTKKMDHSIRKLLEDQSWVAGLPENLKAVAVQTGAVAAATQTPGPTPLTTQRPRRVVEDGEDEDMEEEEPEAPAAPTFDTSNAPSSLFETALQKQAAAWNAKSLTDRYATTNEYTGFYRTVYDAQHPEEDAPPVPQASLWFAAEEGRDQDLARSAEHVEADDDDDFEIAGARIRYKCPITLAPFQDPVTSTKCPHSFEKAAFYDMLRVTTDRLPWTPAQAAELARLHARDRPAAEQRMKTPALSCPECSVLLLASDVVPNPILLRKVKRIQEEIRKKMEAAAASEGDEDADEDEDLVRGTQSRPVGLGSSPPRHASGTTPVKKEKNKASATPSSLPNRTQRSTQRSRTMADDDDDEEDGR